MSNEATDTITLASKKYSVNPQNRKICYVYIEQIKARLDKIGNRI